MPELPTPPETVEVKGKYQYVEEKDSRSHCKTKIVRNIVIIIVTAILS